MNNLRYKSEGCEYLNYSPPQSPSHNDPEEKSSVKLPKLKAPRLSEQEIDLIGRKVLRIKKLCYGPSGCSRSALMDKVLMLKRINRKALGDENQLSDSLLVSEYERKVERTLRKVDERRHSMMAAETYMKRIYF